MHFISFKVKRAYYGALAKARPIAAMAGLTPARFDMMFLIYRSSMFHGMDQDEIAPALGVARMTVSKMLRRMEEQRLIRRNRRLDDRRAFHVRMTREGRMRLLGLMKLLFKKRLMARAYDDAFHYFPPRERQRVLRTFFRDVENFAHSFGDRSRVRYPTGEPSLFQSEGRRASRRWFVECTELRYDREEDSDFRQTGEAR